ncbi:hypothetical protein SCANM63S_03628 [Streptomyces canarius]
MKVRLGAADKEAAIREMAELLGRTGKVVDPEELVATALRREAQGTHRGSVRRSRFRMPRRMR